MHACEAHLRSIHHTKKVFQSKGEEKAKTHVLWPIHIFCLMPFKTTKQKWMCHDCHPTCTFPKLIILSSTGCFLYHFPEYEVLHLPGHPMTATILREMIKETFCTYTDLSSQ